MSDELPEGWAGTDLGSLISGFEAGRNLRAQGRPAERNEYGVLKISAVTWGSFRPNENKALNSDDIPRPHEVVRANDLLISRANTFDLVGAVVLVDRDYPRLMLPDKILRLLVKDDIVDRRYLLHALRSQHVREHFSREATGTSDSMRNLAQPKMSAAPIRLAPVSEQRRIVEKVEALLGQVNRAKARLDRVQAIVRRFRQAVLVAACSGKLTDDFRDSAEAEIDRKQVALEHIPALPEIPDAWGLGPLEAYAQRFQYGTNEKADATAATGTPVLRMGNIQDGVIDLENLKYIRRSRAFDEFLLKPGDVLFNRTNSPELVGKTAVVTSNVPMLFASYLIRVQLDESRLRPTFLSWWLNSAWGREWARRVRTDGVSQSNINATKLASMPIPVPPLKEQDEAIRRGSALLQLAEAVQRRVDAASGRTNSLAHSILSKAFSGELVPTEAELARAEGRSYETAAELLQRVQRESNEQPAATGRRQPRRRSVEATAAQLSDDEPPSDDTSTDGRKADLSDVDAEAQVFAALWRRGALGKHDAVRCVAERLRDQGLVEFKRLRADGALYNQVLAAVETAVKNGDLDRPKRGCVRAVKTEATEYTADDWRHALLTSIGDHPVDREDAVRAAAEWARENMGLAFERLRADGTIEQGLRSAINSAIRRGELVRFDTQRIACGPASGRPVPVKLDKNGIATVGGNAVDDAAVSVTLPDDHELPLDDKANAKVLRKLRKSKPRTLGDARTCIIQVMISDSDSPKDATKNSVLWLHHLIEHGALRLHLAPASANDGDDEAVVSAKSEMPPASNAQDDGSTATPKVEASTAASAPTMLDALQYMLPFDTDVEMVVAMDQVKLLLQALSPATREAVQAAKTTGTIDLGSFRNTASEVVRALIADRQLPKLSENGIKAIVELFNEQGEEKKTIGTRTDKLAAVLRDQTLRAPKRSEVGTQN